MKNDDVYRDIRYRIMSGEYILNYAIPAERDLTSMFNVSRVTVRSAIKALVDEGVLERNGRCGTIVRAVPYPEREKENNRSKTILYVYFSSIAGLRIEQDAETGVIYRGVEAYANRAGYSLMVQSEENYSLHGVPKFVDGVIVGGKDLLGHVLEIRQRGIPVVALSLTPKVDADMVCWDDFGVPPVSKPQQEPSKTAVGSQAPVHTLRKTCELYFKEKGSNVGVNPKTEKDRRNSLSLLMEYLGEDFDISKITRGMMVDIRLNLLQKYPLHRKKLYPNMPLKEVYPPNKKLTLQPHNALMYCQF